MLGLVALLAIVGSATIAGTAQGATGAPSISPATAPHPLDTLTVVPGLGASTPTYQWLLCDGAGAGCSPISGATATTYVVAATDVGHTIRVQENDGSGLLATSFTSGPTLVVIPRNQSPPTIPTAASVGVPLTESHGTWSPSTNVYSYQWFSCIGATCNPISGAVDQFYTPVPADVGTSLKVQETEYSGAVASDPANSNTTSAVAPPPKPVNTSLPTIFGSPAQGQTLTATSGGWSNSPASYTYQWFSCAGSCSPVPSDADPTKYTVQPSEIGHRILVQVTATNGGGNSLPANSPPTGPVALYSTSIGLLVVPSNLVTNQATTLVASVGTTGPTPWSGTVAFLSGGSPIRGCSSVPLSSTTPGAQATCQASFSAASSPELLTAVFTPTSGSGIAGAQSQPLTVGVNRDSTSTALDVSNPTVAVGSTATFTATVAASHSGPFKPSGSVQFLDGGKPIASCSSQALSQSRSGLTAQCTVRYSQTSNHTITATYLGAAGFLRSTSTPATVSVHSVPPRVLGVINSKMHWVFLFTLSKPGYTKVMTMILRQALPGSRILLNCRGKGCPFATRSAVVASCTKGRRCPSAKLRTVNLASRLRNHRLRPGTVLTVKLVRPHWIGKEYVFVIRSGKAPSSRILCLAPGAKRAGVGC